MEVTLYKFNSDNQKTEVTKCSLKKANDLYDEELKKFQDDTSLYSYMDITDEGKVLRSKRA